MDNTSIEQYLEKIRPYLSSMIDELKNQINGKFNWKWILTLDHCKTMMINNAFEKW